MAQRVLSAPTGAYVRPDSEARADTERGRSVGGEIPRVCPEPAWGSCRGRAFARNRRESCVVTCSVIAAADSIECVDPLALPRVRSRPAPSCVVLVIRGAPWRVRVAELARWIGVDVATLRRWRRADNFDRARGLAPDLLRALAPRAWRLTPREAADVRAAYERGGSLAATHALLVTAMMPADPEPARAPTPTRSLFGRERAAAFNYCRGTDRVGAYGR